MSGDAEVKGKGAAKAEPVARAVLEWAAMGLVLFAFGAYVGFDIHQSRQAVEAQERSRLEHGTGIVEKNLAPRFEATVNALDAIRAEVPELRARADGLRRMDQRMQVLVSSMSGVRSFLLVDREGRIVASNLKELVGQDMHEGERYRTIRARPDPSLVFVSPPFTTPLGNWAIAMGRAVVDEKGGFDGYVLAVIDPAYFALLLESTRYATDMSASMVHGDGTVIYRIPDPKGIVGMNLAEPPDTAFARHVRSGRLVSSYTTVLKTTGKESLVVLRTIRPTIGATDSFLVAALGRETDAMFAPWRKEARERSLILGIVALAAVVGLFIHQKRRTAVSALRAAQEADRRSLEEAQRKSEALRESEASFRAMAESAPIGIFRADGSGSNVYLNRAASEILGQKPEDGRGRAWHEDVHPEDRERVFREWREAVAERRVHSTEHRLVRPDGEVVLMQIHAAPIRGEEPGSSGFVGVMIDVTRQREADKQLALGARLAAMGTLVSGVSHEINNPLAAVISGQALALEILAGLGKVLEGDGAIDRRREASRLGEARESLEDAQECGRRIERIVKDMARFASPNSQRERTSLRSVVAEAKRGIPAETWQTITLQVDDEGAPDILASRGLLHQLVVSLISNAAKATPNGERDTVLVRIGPGSPGMARLDVTDNGVGIPYEMREKIFDFFYTTRPTGEGRGLGLGLALCRSIAMSHGGTLTVESEVGLGSTFRVEIPAAPPLG